MYSSELLSELFRSSKVKQLGAFYCPVNGRTIFLEISSTELLNLVLVVSNLSFETFFKISKNFCESFSKIIYSFKIFYWI